MPGVHVVTRPRLSQVDLLGREESLAPATPDRHRRLLGRGGLFHRRVDPAAARRRRGGAGRAFAAHPQRAGGALSDPATSIIWWRRTPSGMGLNLDVDHVAFAADKKFDGFRFRKLQPAELGADCRPRRPAHARRNIRHDRPLPALRRRHRRGAGEPRFRSRPSTSMAKPGSRTSHRLIDCGEALPTSRASRAHPRAGRRGSGRARTARPRARHRRLRPLQRCGRTPLAGLPGARLPQGFAADPRRSGRADLPLPDEGRSGAGRTGSPGTSTRCDRTDGDIDTLSNRISQVRTWSFVANRPDWLKRS